MYRLAVLTLLANHPVEGVADKPSRPVSVPELAAWSTLARDICNFRLIPPHSHVRSTFNAAGWDAYKAAMSEASADIAANGVEVWCEAIRERAGQFQSGATNRR